MIVFFALEGSSEEQNKEYVKITTLYTCCFVV